MYYNIRHIKSQGFMSFDELEFDLENLGLVQVKGKNEFEPKADSNGSGKSALFEMVIWLLTGHTSRGSSEVGNQITGTGVYVEGNLSIDDHDYFIRRSKNHELYKSSLYVEKDGEDISGNTLTKSKAILSDELGELDYDTLTSIIILSQGLPSRLSTLKPSSRKSRLEELSNTEMYIEEVKSKLDKAIRSISEDQVGLSNKMVSIDTEINSLNLSISSNTRKLEDIRSKSNELISEEEYLNIEKELLTLRDALQKRGAKVQDLNSKLNKLKSLTSIDTSTLERHKVDIQKLLDQYNSISASICPTCHTVLDSPEKLQSMKDSISQRILELKQDCGKILTSLSEYKDKIPHIEEEISFNNKEISEINNNIGVLTMKCNNYKSYSTSTDFLLESIDSSKLKISELENSKLGLTKELQEITNKISIANFYKSHVSRNFRAFLLEGVITYMNNKSKEYSPYLFDKQGYVSLKIEGNNINIYLGDRRFEDLSGGEGRRVDIILQLIQRDLAKNESGLSSNILVLDEILDYLDSAGINSVMSLVEHKSPDVGSMLVVTHKKDVVIPSDSTMTVVKSSNQISHLR